MTEKNVSKAFLVAALIIVVWAPVFFSLDSSIKVTTASKAYVVGLEAQGILKQENATRPLWAPWKREQPEQERENNTNTSEMPSTDETEGNEEPKEEIVPIQTREGTGKAIDQSHTPAPTITPAPTSTPTPTDMPAPTSTPARRSTPPPNGNTPGLGISTNRVDLGVFYDSACTQLGKSMNLGSISPDESVNTTLYLKNTGSSTLKLSLRTKNWNPKEANGPVALTWNLEGAELSVNQVSTATLTLSVSPTIQGITSFSFDVVISGTE